MDCIFLFPISWLIINPWSFIGDEKKEMSKKKNKTNKDSSRASPSHSKEVELKDAFGSNDGSFSSKGGRLPLKETGKNKRAVPSLTSEETSQEDKEIFIFSLEYLFSERCLISPDDPARASSMGLLSDIFSNSL
ncbi:hypothetical protein C5167_026666 [Papaver somniferum]|nr:hypothetical protein C5167_026666 [Papaver somniferum]